MDEKLESIVRLAESQFNYALHQQHTKIIKSIAPRALMATPAPPDVSPPDVGTVTDYLNNISKGVASTSIVSVPDSPPQEMVSQLAQMVSGLQTLNSYVAVLTAFCVYNEHPDPYDITDPVQAAQFEMAWAKFQNYIMTGGKVKDIVAYLPPSSITAGKPMDKSVLSADLHLEFLTTIFGSLSLPAAEITELDGVLTTIADSIKNIKLKWTDASQTYDHVICYNHVTVMEGTGTGTQFPAVPVMNVTLFNMHIDQKSFEVSIGKSSVGKFNFKMNYFEMGSIMNASEVANNLTSINATIKSLCGQDTDAVNKLMNMSAIKGAKIQ